MPVKDINSEVQYSFGPRHLNEHNDFPASIRVADDNDIIVNDITMYDDTHQRPREYMGEIPLQQ